MKNLSLILVFLISLLTYGCMDLKPKPMSDVDMMELAEGSADSKLSALTPLGTTPATTDYMYLVDDETTDLDKSITVGNLLGSVVKTEEINTLAELETVSNGGAYMSDMLAATSEANFKSIVNLEIDTDVQAWDADLDTYAGITPSANVQTLLGAASYAAFIAILDGVGPWDFGSAVVDLGDADLTLPAEASFQSIAVADLGDATTPSVLTTAETINKAISNYKATGADHVFTMPAAHEAGNVIFYIGDGFQVDIEPYSTTYFIFNGTAMAASEHIQNTSDTKYTEITGYCINDEGTLRWHFKSSSTDWVEETP